MLDQTPDAGLAMGETAESGKVRPEVSCSRQMPLSRQEERPTIYADRVGEWCVGQASGQWRKAHGIFLTPVPVADFMAGQIVATGRNIRVLDPAAGAGILCCATVEVLLARHPKPEVIELVAYELDGDLALSLRTVLDYLARWCQERHGTVVNTRIEVADFILANGTAMRQDELFSSRTQASEFDAVIANPPYFKIGKHDPCAMAVPDVVHGQPNIYTLFMAVSAALLRSGGRLVFITPRSYASGPCFLRFRALFFDMIRPAKVHVFGSRRDAFGRDDVLQENIILSGIRHDRWRDNAVRVNLGISSSSGVAGIDDAESHELPVGDVLDLGSVNKVLRLPIRGDDDDALKLVDSWPNSLHGLGLNISTGPVVPFRAAHLVAQAGQVPSSHAPLLWMNHVRAMRATWPLHRHKPEYSRGQGATMLLVPNRNYVLLRRFSAKKQARRLMAAPWIAEDASVIDIGLENHLNYVHRPGGTLSIDEAWGLAALYNSRLVDTWFRAINGNTQVSATELRSMPLPSHEEIVILGRCVKRLADPLSGLDALVSSVIASPARKEAALG